MNLQVPVQLIPCPLQRPVVVRHSHQGLSFCLHFFVHLSTSEQVRLQGWIRSSAMLQFTKVVLQIDWIVRGLLEKLQAFYGRFVLATWGIVRGFIVVGRGCDFNELKAFVFVHGFKVQMEVVGETPRGSCILLSNIRSKVRLVDRRRGATFSRSEKEPSKVTRCTGWCWLEKMESAKIRCWNKTHKKWNGNWHWESQHHRVKDGWKRLLNGTQNWAQDKGPTERLEDREKDGKNTSTNSSNKNLKKLKTQSKAAIKPTKLGST